MVSKDRRQLRRRSIFWSVLAVVLFGLLGARLFSIQVLGHELYTKKAKDTQGRRWPIPAPRGNIYDRHGTPLALNLEVFAVAADPERLTGRRRTARRLAPLIRLSEEEIFSKLTCKPGSRHVELCDSVDGPVAEAIRECGLSGVKVETEWKRAYPHETLAAAVIGFVGKDGAGLGGMEAVEESILAGEAGEKLVVLDGRLPNSRSQIPDRTVVTRQMRPGESLTLTVDLAIQSVAEEELAKAVEASNAAGGTALVMDPQTGEILALATQPGFDPNRFLEYDEGTWVSNAVSSPFEPGSTFKPVIACAGIEEGVMSKGQVFTCSGTRAVGNRTIGCALHGGTRAHGQLDLDGMVVKSCNVGMATVALGLGAERTYRWVRRFGLGERTGIELSGESAGQLSRPQNWAQIQLANIGFGQGISVTPVQLLSAYCAIANGGRRVSARLRRRATDGPGEAKGNEAGQRIMSSKTSERMRLVLERVVTEGTGKAARVPGYRVAGKTGTAQKPVPGVGFKSGLYTGSFVGFAPVERPRVAILVVIDEPKGSHYGGVVAAPAFQAICAKTLAYLRVPPDAHAASHVVASAALGD